jgi:hypothetical protein
LPLGSGILVLNKHRTPANPATQQLIQQAGTHNVSYTMSAIITHLLLNPTKLQIMRAELAPVFAKTNLPTWRTLEKLPYLTAVIKEGLRSAFLFLLYQSSTNFAFQNGNGRDEPLSACIPLRRSPLRQMDPPKGLSGLDVFLLDAQ